MTGPCAAVRRRPRSGESTRASSARALRRRRRIQVVQFRDEGSDCPRSPRGVRAHGLVGEEDAAAPMRYDVAALPGVTNTEASKAWAGAWLINARHERASTVLTSNKGFEEWGAVLGGRGDGRRAHRPPSAPLPHRQHPRQQLPHEAPPGTAALHAAIRGRRRPGNRVLPQSRAAVPGPLPSRASSSEATRRLAGSAASHWRKARSTAWRAASKSRASASRTSSRRAAPSAPARAAASTTPGPTTSRRAASTASSTRRPKEMQLGSPLSSQPRRQAYRGMSCRRPPCRQRHSRLIEQRQAQRPALLLEGGPDSQVGSNLDADSHYSSDRSNHYTFRSVMAAAIRSHIQSAATIPSIASPISRASRPVPNGSAERKL